MVCLVHYGEIALKGGNRGMFEDKLVNNIKKALYGSRVFFKSVKKPYGRIVIELDEKTDKKRLEDALKTVFGITHFSFAKECELDIETIKQEALKELGEKKFSSFKIESKRGNKNFALTSQEINETIGEVILSKFKGKKVNLDNPDIVLFIEIAYKKAFLYTEKISGLAGLPLGISSKAVCLLSGGIDSPVAAYLCMRRGVQSIFLHFHSFPKTNQASIDKVKQLVKVLSKFQGESKLCSVPFIDIQKEILLNTKEKLRVVLYRRFMLKIAEKIAEKERAFALITGENIGQVASQTLPNISAIENAVKIPVFRPLIADDKQDIIKKAREIGTYDISIIEHQDCCSLFTPKMPETRANLKEVEKEEQKLDVDGLIEKALKNTTIEIIE